MFRVKYVNEGSVYIDAGRNADLEEGMKLSVVEAPPDGVIAKGFNIADTRTSPNWRFLPSRTPRLFATWWKPKVN